MLFGRHIDNGAMCQLIVNWLCLRSSCALYYMQYNHDSVMPHPCSPVLFNVGTEVSDSVAVGHTNSSDDQLKLQETQSVELQCS